MQDWIETDRDRETEREKCWRRMATTNYWKETLVKVTGSITGMFSQLSRQDSMSSYYLFCVLWLRVTALSPPSKWSRKDIKFWQLIKLQTSADPWHLSIKKNWARWGTACTKPPPQLFGRIVFHDVRLLFVAVQWFCSYSLSSRKDGGAQRGSKLRHLCVQYSAYVDLDKYMMCGFFFQQLANCGRLLGCIYPCANKPNVTLTLFQTLFFGVFTQTYSRTLACVRWTVNGTLIWPPTLM